MGMFDNSSALTQDLCDYIEYFDELPVLLSCNLAAANLLPSKKYNCCLKIQMDVYLSNFGTGFLSDSELVHINEIENMIISQIDGIYAGHGIVCAKGYMFIMFYISEKSKKKYLDFLGNVFAASYRNFKADVLYDPLGNEYKKFLYPDKYQLKELDNKKVLNTLKRNSDDGSKVREIIFKLNFSGKDSVIACASEAFKNGFAFKDMMKGSTPTGIPQFILILKIDAPFNLEDINKKTRYLMDLAKSHSGIYKGLETEINK